jgi:acetyl esterase/lipase
LRAIVVTLVATGCAARAPVAEPEVMAQSVTADEYPEHRVKFAGDVIGIPDVTYATLPGFRPLTLDLYLPPASLRTPRHGFPLVVHLHGGGWTAGHARHAGAFANFPAVLASLAAQGHVVASVNYRLAHEARFPAAVIDIKTAIRWLRSKAAEYHMDPARAVVWGGSAGGQLAGLVSVTCGVRAFDRAVSGSLPPEVASQSDCVQGAVTWYGLFDFATLREQAGAKEGESTRATRAATAYLGCNPLRCDKSILESASSTSYVDQKDPPMLLIHGTADEVVPYRQSEQMATKLREAGIWAELMLITGVGHGFVGDSPGLTRDASLKALRATFVFIERATGVIE